ncbi:acetyl-CoA carboxylase biotin carboxylase subunit family protein, partial [Thioalkalivibrio sp.]|uniref:ATP-grasp domain-containing protein n=1 Tax=Thioalkalivibrio sp. TaxID=2093813 RepID=UPI003975BFFD
GHRVVTCDYLPGNPGHALADEYHNVSTTDKDAVLDLARRLRIDGILAFASDPAAPTAAWVAEHMGLPGNPYQTVRMMSEKDLFRAFLQDHGFRCPAFRAYRSVREMHADPQRPPLPVMVKPVDSSGSKGVGRADRPDQLGPLFRKALPLSRAGRVIVEQCIDGHQLHGDGFVCDGKLVFSCLGDHQAAGALNSSTLYPSRFPAGLIARIQAETQRFLDLAGFRQGGINIEARLDGDREPFHIIEIGPRNGGHFTPDIITHATGFDFVSLSVDTCLGAPCTPAPLRPSPHPQGWFTNLVLYAPRPGRYTGVQLSPELEPFLLEKHLYKHRGDQLGSGTTSQTAVGTLLLKFGDRGQMERVIARNRDFYRVDMEPAPRESIDA